MPAKADAAKAAEPVKMKSYVVGAAKAYMDGRVYEVGDTRERFTIQSISKPLVYGVALEDRGLEAVGASLYEALEAAGHRPVRALQRLRAVNGTIT